MGANVYRQSDCASCIGPDIPSALAGIEHKIGKVLDAIESVGISASLTERLRELEAAKADAEERLRAAQIDRQPLDALLGQVMLKPKNGVLRAYPTLKPEKPTLNESRPLILVAGAGFPFAASRLSCSCRFSLLCEQLRLRVNLLPRRFKHCSLPNKKGPLFDGPFFCLVAGARYTNYMQIEIEPFPLAS